MSLIVVAILMVAPVASVRASSTERSGERTTAAETTVPRTATTPATQLLAPPPQFGIVDQSFSGASTAPSGSKPESKLWFNDGIWWAYMWDTVSSQFHIFRLASNGLAWTDTGTVVDSRGTTRGDALWDGTKLYIASHDFASDSSHNTANRPARLYRFSYNSGTKTWSKDSGFPATITTVSVETLVLDKDSTGMLWATWTQAKKLMISHTTGSDLTWATPFTPAITGTSLSSDDISSVIAYGGNRIGVMWSNQSSSHMYFTSHADGSPDTTWTASEAATTGSGSADDHINLKTDSAGRIYSAVKTSLTSSSSTLIQLLVRASGGGWSAYRFGTVGESHTRPIVLIDEGAGVVHMYATGPFPGHSSGQSGGSIFEKTAPLSAISFSSGSGTPVIQDPSGADMNNASSTKQNVSAATGRVILATNDTSNFYWHATQALGSGTPPTANFTGTPTSGASPLTVQFTDTSTGGPTSWSWDFGDTGSGVNNTSALRSPSHIYNTNGTFTVKLTASNAAGPNTKTMVGYITVASQPVASFSATQTTGPAPLGVSFTDTSTNSPTSWLWDFGDPASGSVNNTSSLQNPSHTYNTDGTYTVTLTATNVGGSNSITQSAYITVATPPTANFTATPTSGLAPLPVQFNDTSTNNPTAWSWDFGDSATSLDQNPSHTYTADGTYTVTLTATNGVGSDPEVKTGYIVVGAVPTADFSGSPLSGDAGQAVQFTDLSSNTPVSWLWDFGDSSSSTTQSPLHTYAADGRYTVKLTATNAAGSNTMTKVNYVTIGVVPTASFDATPTSGTAPVPVAFTDTSSGNPTSWLWNFGDPGSGSANTSVLRNPSHTYTGGGNFTVSLTATNALGSTTSTQTGLITVTASNVTVTLNPIADAHVSSSNLVGNYGTLTTMKVREGDGSSANPNYRAYLKFDVSGVSGTVSAVTLRVFITDPSANLESVFVVADSSWTETGITYTNAPAMSGSAVGTTQSAPVGAYVSITLVPTSVTPGTSPLTLAIKSSATDSFVVSSREDATNKPQLIVTYH